MIPCPFCGGGVRFNAYFTAYMCEACEALGPRGDNEEQAADAWNGRFFGAKNPDKRSLSNDLPECEDGIRP